MIKGGGKRKGGAFERSICERLSLWITGGQKKDCLWRSAMSGGRATVSKGMVRQCGDVCAVAPEGHVLTDFYFIECKHVRDLNLWGIFRDTGNLRKFWLQAVAESSRYGKRPMLIAKQNNCPTLVCALINQFSAEVDVMMQIPKMNMEIYLFDDLLKTEYQP